MTRPIFVPGSPAGPGRPAARPWRARIAAAVRDRPETDGVALAFTLEPGRWIDLDTVTEVALAGLRDGGLLAPRFAGLAAFVATKAFAGSPGVRIGPTGAAAVRRAAPPGPVALDVGAPVVLRPGAREAKRAWREALAAGWARRPVLTGNVWVDLSAATARSLVAPLEPALDALEPVLGRDPRGRDWQEFFPNDDRIVWLRVRRTTTGPPLRLRLGPVPERWSPAGAAAALLPLDSPPPAPSAGRPPPRG